MSDNNERIEEDYYAGYYWGRNPYDSEYLSTEKTDDELKNKVLQNLQRNSIYSDAIIVSVHGGLVLIGILEGNYARHKDA